METNLVVSLDIAKQILNMKKSEMEMLIIVLQDVDDLSDELVCLFAEFWNVSNKEFMALKEVIKSLEQQIKIFGKIGLIKDIEIAPKEDYPDDQQSDNN